MDLYHVSGDVVSTLRLGVVVAFEGEEDEARIVLIGRDEAMLEIVSDTCTPVHILLASLSIDYIDEVGVCEGLRPIQYSVERVPHPTIGQELQFLPS